MRAIRRLVIVLACLTGAPAWAILEFKNFLVVSPFLDGTNWFLTKPLLYQIPTTEAVVEVPAGFQTDFASIPRPFWSVLPTWGRYGAAAVVHDFLYWDQRCTREQADAVMLLAMTESDVGSGQRWVIYRAVRLGGKFAWKGNRKRRTAGMERVIPYWPTDPKETWRDFQRGLYESEHRPERRPSDEPAPDYCQEALRAWRAYMVTQR